MRSNTRRIRAAAFTLIELPVVLAIIANSLAMLQADDSNGNVVGFE